MSYLKSYDLPGKLNKDCTAFVFDNPSFTSRVLKKWQDSELFVKIQKLSKNRSDAQNRWLWGVCYVKIASWHYDNEGVKYQPEEIHAFVCTRILGYKYNQTEIMGQEVLILEGARTSKMTTVEFMEAKEKIQAFYAELGLEIPDPTQLSFLTDYSTK